MDVILTEVLQGAIGPRSAVGGTSPARLPVLRLEGLDDFVLAADLYRTARHAGVTVRKTLDCLIAAPCVRTNAPLLHADSDFDRLATCTPLRVWEPEQRA
jgi:predicted nucleic acid-binding protein